MTQPRGGDDLVPLLAQQQAEGRVEMGQATIVSYDPSDNTHTLEFRGARISNVGVVKGISAMGYQPGDVVLLQGWIPKRGPSTWWILGQALIPGQDSPDLTVRGSDIIIEGGNVVINSGQLRAADDSGDVFRVDPDVPEIFMRQALLTDLARAIIGDAVSFDSAAASGSRSGGSFGTFGTIDANGPEVTFDVINGSFIALWGAQVDVTADVGEDVAGYMDLDVDGPTSSSPPDSPTTGTGALGRIGASSESGVQVLQTSLMAGRSYSVTPGTYTVECLYRTDDVSGSPALGQALWRNRFLMVIAF